MAHRILLSIAVGTLALTGTAQAQSSRDYISIVGSSTVYPFTTAVAEHFGRAGQFKTPKVESTGTGGGLKLFCNGVGVSHPDIANASRRIKQSEIDACAKNGVKDIVELKIGYDGIVLAGSRKAPNLKLSRRDVYLALAKQIPDPANSNTLIANPNRTWKQVNAALPDRKIEVLGPPPTSGTRDAFVELFMEPGCSQFAWIKSLKDVDEGRFKRVCDSLREDGAYIEAGENDNLIVQKLEANPAAVGVFGYSYLEENDDKLQGSLIEGVGPVFEAIASGKYPAARPLFIYVKKAHIGVIPGIQEFLAEYTSDKALGEEGYLADKGLIPPSSAERTTVRADATALKNVKL
ncbi:MAG TPA: PstS family phosphate ABC transporter substrate-binding protein [Steroidobacteraceae bacterium]|nr:PstS family phosphate ABC transporter substrate-binding protein [Steroidobacteraceae bacterium]